MTLWDETFARRMLPHWFMPGAVFFVTYRIAGTIPKRVVDEWRAESRVVLQAKGVPGEPPAQRRTKIHKQFFAKYDRYLDSERSVDWLARENIAKIIRENLYHHDGTKYHLLAYSIMPNHVHILIQPIWQEGELPDATPRLASSDESPLSDNTCGSERPDIRSPLSNIMHSLKSYTANRVNAVLRRTGQFWQRESYDHWVRDLDELDRIAQYIAANPVAAGMARRAEDWVWSSAHDRFQLDGLHSGILKAPIIY